MARETLTVPDIGGAEDTEVIEVSVAVGERVELEQSLIVLESDKASMEIPAMLAGTVVAVLVKEGDSLAAGAAIVVLDTDVDVEAVAVASAPESPPQPVEEPGKEPAPAPKAAPAQAPLPTPPSSQLATAGSAAVYAGPAVRKLAREFGVELGAVSGSGPKGRILKEDIQGFVKRSLCSGAGAATTAGAGIAPIPEVDFSAFGAVDSQPLSRLAKLTAANMQRSWLNVPHVTQFDEVDITELEAFRADLKADGERRGIRLTPLPFLLQACAVALRDNPRLNASLSVDGQSMVFKQYIHIGMAVDTPAGLVVPVLRDVDQQSLWELAAATADLTERARHRKLKPSDMQGACFTISSLGGIGGNGFTPIVNAPEVAILGVSKLTMKPVWNGNEFTPRKMLPLALSYDHRAVNGADGGRFMAQLGSLLADIRRLLL